MWSIHLLRKMNLNAADIILPDFADIWFTNCEARYRVLKGARETGKSYNFIGIEPLFKILSDHRRNIMMVRQNDKDNAQSTYVQLKAAAYRMGIAHLFKFKKSPFTITRITTGQVILFAGMNDVQNITSTTVEHGYWTDIYFEEFSQVKNKDDFLIVDGSLRVPNEEDDLFCQITMCMNAWDVGHWSNETFFEGNLEDDVKELEENRFQFAYKPDFNIGFGFGLGLHISSFKTNTHRAKDKDHSMEILKNKNYDYYKVVGLGCWGNVADKTYYEWKEDLIHDGHKMITKVFNTVTIGIDFGMSNGEGKIKYSEDNAKRLGSANTMILCGVADNWSKIIAVDEYFDSNDGRDDDHKKHSYEIQQEEIACIKKWIDKYELWDRIVSIYVDCADSGGYIDGLMLEAEKQGLFNVDFVPSSKIKILSRVYFENTLMGYDDLWVSDNCPNLIREIKNARKAPDGRVREDYDDHAINAFEYGWIPIRQKLKRWKTFKEPD